MLCLAERLTVEIQETRRCWLPLRRGGGSCYRMCSGRREGRQGWNRENRGENTMSHRPKLMWILEGPVRLVNCC